MSGPENPRQGPPTRALIGLVVIIAVVFGAYWMLARIHASNTIQDCVMAGRHNCAPVGQ